jgi:hypothetical protein
MSKNINLQKSREIATAARLFGGLTCRLASMVTDERISRKEDVIRVGIPGTIQAIDHMLDLQRQMLVVGHSFAQFLATHPDVPGLVPHDFACGITERDVLTYVCGVIVGDEGADAAGDTLFGVIEYALPTIENEHHEPHLTSTTLAL